MLPSHAFQQNISFPFGTLIEVAGSQSDLYHLVSKKERARIPCDSPRGGFTQVHIPGLKCFTAKPRDRKELLDLLAVFEVKSYWLGYEGSRQKSRESTYHPHGHHIIATCMIHLLLMLFHLHAVYADCERCLWMLLGSFLSPPRCSSFSSLGWGLEKSVKDH